MVPLTDFRSATPPGLAAALEGEGLALVADLRDARSPEVRLRGPVCGRPLLGQL